MTRKKVTKRKRLKQPRRQSNFNSMDQGQSQPANDLYRCSKNCVPCFPFLGSFHTKGKVRRIEDATVGSRNTYPKEWFSCELKILRGIMIIPTKTSCWFVSITTDPASSPCLDHQSPPPERGEKLPFSKNQLVVWQKEKWKRLFVRIFLYDLVREPLASCGYCAFRTISRWTKLPYI